MADDLDDLLDEVEESFAKSELRPVEDKRSVKTDDLNDLLDDFEPPPAPFESGSYTPSPNTSVDNSKKCASVYIGGTSLPKGVTTVTTQRSCGKLRCIKCDFPVVSFDGFVWTDKTDYLFLRNNYPDINRLRPRLDSLRGSRAYACQCQFRSVREPHNVDRDKTLQWVCGKH